MHKVNKSSNSYSSYVAILWIFIVHLRFISLRFATPPPVSGGVLAPPLNVSSAITYIRMLGRCHQS